MDADTHFWLSIASTVLYYTIYPLLILGTAVVYLVRTVASPFIYLAFIIQEIALLPVRFLAKFEASNPIWYFLGTAVLIGAFFGLVLHLFGRTLIILIPDRKSTPKDTQPTGHDAVSYRAARQEKKDKELARQQRRATQARLMASQPLLQQAVREARHQIPLPAPASSSSAPLSPGTQRPAISREIILEHTDEEDDDSVFF